MTDGPLIVQSDKSLLLEVDHPSAQAARIAIAAFAELERAPEHVHTYRITDLGLWNARAAGYDAETVVAALVDHSRYPVPHSLLIDVADTMDRYGRLQLLSDPQHGLVLHGLDRAVLEEVTRAKRVQGMLGLTEEEIGEYSGTKKEIRPVTIATYQVMASRRKGVYTHLELFDARDWGLVVYDEVHLLPAPIFRMTADLQARRRLGLTATLVREDGREGDVFSLIGPKRYDAPWKDIEAQGYIAPAVCTEVRVTLPASDRMAYAMAEASDRPRLGAAHGAKVPVVERIARAHPGEPLLVIGQYLDQLEEIAEHLGAELLTGQTPVKRRQQLFADFREGRIDRLVVSKVANFSVDLPEASVAIQVSGAFGSRQEEAQRLGRLLRPKADGRSAHFYTVVMRDTQDQDFAAHRQRFLAEQGYAYSIVDAEQLDGALDAG